MSATDRPSSTCSTTSTVPRRHRRVPIGGLGSTPAFPFSREHSGSPEGDEWGLALATLVEQAAGAPGTSSSWPTTSAVAAGRKVTDWVPSGVADLGLPDTIVDLVRRRRRSLDGVHQEILGAAAVLGPTFDLDTLAASPIWTSAR